MVYSHHFFPSITGNAIADDSIPSSFVPAPPPRTTSINCNLSKLFDSSKYYKSAFNFSKSSQKSKVFTDLNKLSCDKGLSKNGPSSEVRFGDFVKNVEENKVTSCKDKKGSKKARPKSEIFISQSTTSNFIKKSFNRYSTIEVSTVKLINLLCTLITNLYLNLGLFKFSFW